MNTLANAISIRRHRYYSWMMGFHGKLGPSWPQVVQLRTVIRFRQRQDLGCALSSPPPLFLTWRADDSARTLGMEDSGCMS